MNTFYLNIMKIFIFAAKHSWRNKLSKNMEDDLTSTQLCWTYFMYCKDVAFTLFTLGFMSGLGTCLVLTPSPQTRSSWTCGQVSASMMGTWSWTGTVPYTVQTSLVKYLYIRNRVVTRQITDSFQTNMASQIWCYLIHCYRWKKLISKKWF